MSIVAAEIKCEIPVKIIRITKGRFGRSPSVTFEVQTERGSGPITVHAGATALIHYDLNLKP